MGFGGDDDDDVSVEFDPRSTDFGKIKVGDTRYDIWGGFQQYVRLISQVISGSAKSAATGKIRKLDGSGMFGQTRLDQVGKFLRGKLAPVPATFMNLGYGKDVIGNEVTPSQEALKVVTPLVVKDVTEAIKNKGVSAFFSIGLPATFGIGVNTISTKIEDVEDIPGLGVVTEDRLKEKGVESMSDLISKQSALKGLKYKNAEGKLEKILSKKQLYSIDSIINVIRVNKK